MPLPYLYAIIELSLIWTFKYRQRRQGRYKLVIDADCGEKTESAIKNFQISEKLKVDGLFGEKSLARAKKVKK